MKHRFRPRLTPPRRPIATERVEAVHYGIGAWGRILVSQELFDQLKAGASTPAVDDIYAKFGGMPVEVSPSLPFTRTVATPAVGAAARAEGRGR